MDAGHFQFEADLVSFSIGSWNADGERFFGVNVANVNLKAGLYNNVDLQLVVENYIYEHSRRSSALRLTGLQPLGKKVGWR